MQGGEYGEEWEPASEQRVRRVSDLNLLRGFVAWGLEGGIKVIARLMRLTTHG
jgi:hypothetical protein